MVWFKHIFMSSHTVNGLSNAKCNNAFFQFGGLIPITPSIVFNLISLSKGFMEQKTKQNVFPTAKYEELAMDENEIYVFDLETTAISTQPQYTTMADERKQ